MRSFTFCLCRAEESRNTSRSSSEELTLAHLAHIEALDGRVTAFVEVLGERALREARAADRQLDKGRGERLTDLIAAECNAPTNNCRCICSQEAKRPSSVWI